MADAASLRQRLQNTDASAPGIQGSASAMMKHYDRSASVAVAEWRNALHQSRLDQRLPLLYVANEVLQTSKRNRGSKFLEAFSPILGQSLIFMCQGAPVAMVEKIRRTVKIWGDRFVFSVRFVGEILKGLEPYRNGSTAQPQIIEEEETARFSPQTDLPSSPKSHYPEAASPTPAAPKASPRTSKPVIDIDAEMRITSPSHMGDGDSYSSDDQFGADHDDDSDDADGGNIFGEATGGISLDIKVDLDAAAAVASQTGQQQKNKKRRRSSTASTSNRRRRATVLSTNSLLELWNQVNVLQQGFEHASTLVASLDDEYLNADRAQIESLVGDELLVAYKRVLQDERRINEARREYHRIAQERRTLEAQGIRYLPWLEAALKQDAEDLAFLDKLEKDILFYSEAQQQAQAARAERLALEAQRQQEAEEKRRKQEEEEERKKFMESAMKKETEAKPGMVWNKATGEYQYLNLDEDWRD